MKRYTEKDIKVIRWEDHARRRPEMYFGPDGPSASKIADALKEVAMILGAESTEIKAIGEWTIFSADTDWIFNSEVKIESVESVFVSIRPFPETGEQNSYRYEALTTPFSSDVFSISNGKLCVIKGKAPSEELIKQTQSNSAGRVVGFKYVRSA